MTALAGILSVDLIHDLLAPEAADGSAAGPRAGDEVAP